MEAHIVYTDVIIDLRKFNEPIFHCMAEIKIDKLIRSKRRSIGLQIARDATLIVRAPVFATLQDVRRVVDAKSNWIIAKQTLVRTRLANVKQKEYVAGEEFLYLGKRYALEFTAEIAVLAAEAERIRIPEGKKERAEEVLTTWYQSEALKVISERVSHFANRNGLPIKSVKISKAKSRWGSCGPTGSLLFNWRLIMAPLFVIDYVVVHELAHLKIRDHSKRFWNEVASVMPDYEKAERWLKENHWELDI